MQMKISLSLLMLLVAFCSADSKKVEVRDKNAALIQVNEKTTMLNVHFQDSSWACFGPKKFTEIGLRLSDGTICKEKMKRAALVEYQNEKLKTQVAYKDSSILYMDSVIQSDSTMLGYKDSIIVLKDSIITNREEVIKLAEDAQMGIIELLGYIGISFAVGFFVGYPL